MSVNVRMTREGYRRITRIGTFPQLPAGDQPLDALLLRLNPALRGWCAYFRTGVSNATFSYLRYYLWHTVWGWMPRKHPKTSWKKIRSHYGGRGSWWASGERKLFDPCTVSTTRYRYRGAAIPTPWATSG